MKKSLLFISLLGLIPLSTTAETRVQARDIINQINSGKNVEYRNAEIVGNLDLTKLDDQTEDKASRRKRFFRGSRTYWTHVRGSLVFIDCVFDGDFIAYEHNNWKNHTYNVVFHKNVNFSGSQFKGISAFKYCKFNENADFQKTHFHQEALFKYTNFFQDIRFNGSVFINDANFKYTKFPVMMNFQGTEFRREANFKYAKFPEGVDFSRVEFNQTANFKYTKFSKPVSFENASFNGRPDFKYTKLNGSRYSPVRSDSKRTPQ